MRNTITVFAVGLAILTGSSAASAQFRLNGGLNLSSFFGADVADSEGKRGLDLGASFSLLRIGPLQLRAEGYYRQKGARGAQDFQSAALQGGIAEIGIDYIEVPVLLRFDVPVPGRRLLPYLEAGPAFAWRIDCGISFDAATGTNDSSCDDLNGDNLEETLKEYEQGLVLGGGVDVPILGMGAINIDARYTRGLSRLTEDNEIHNRAFSIMLGYSFGLPSRFGGGPMGLR